MEGLLSIKYPLTTPKQTKSLDAPTSKRRTYGIWKLEKFGRLEKNRWTDISSESKELTLILKNMLLIILNGELVLDSVSLFSEFHRAAYKNGTLAFAISQPPNIMVRKIRMKFANCGIHSGMVMGLQCVEMLKHFITIQGSTDKWASMPQKMPLQEWVTNVLSNENSDSNYGAGYESKYDLKEMILTCILDPEFPTFVSEINMNMKKLENND